MENASQDDLELLEAISILLGRNQRLLAFLFHPHKAILRKSATRLKKEMGCLSSGEQVLLNIALDFWSEEGEVHFNGLYQILCPRSFKNCLDSLIYIKRNLYS